MIHWSELNKNDKFVTSNNNIIKITFSTQFKSRNTTRKLTSKLSNLQQTPIDKLQLQHFIILHYNSNFKTFMDDILGTLGSH